MHVALHANSLALLFKAPLFEAQLFEKGEHTCVSNQLVSVGWHGSSMMAHRLKILLVV